MSDKLAEHFLNNYNALDNIGDIRQRLRREKTVVDSQLQAGVDGQSKILASGLSALTNARSRLSNIKQNVAEIHNSHQKSFNTIAGFDKLEKLSTVASNFDLAQKFLDNFVSLGAEINHITGMMDSDGDFNSLDSQMPLLLSTHYAIDQQRQIQDQAMRYASKSTEDVRQTIRKHYSPLDRVVTRFDRRILEIADRLLDLSRVGNRSLVVRTARIIDFEEKKNLILETTDRLESRQPFSRNSVPAKRARRNYVNWFFSAVENAVNEKFEAYVEKYSPEERPDKLLEKFEWVFKDLLVVKNELVPCVPERWSVLDRYVKFYHQNTHKVLNMVMSFEPSAAILLRLLEFTKGYHTTMKELFGIDKQSMEPPLLDGKENELYDDYLRLLVAKLKEWYQNVALLERKPFVVRSTAPDTTPDNTLCLNSHTDMAKLVSQQLDAAAESGQGRIVLGCVNACCDILVQRQQEWTQLVDEEVRKEISGTVEEVPPGLFEYLIALANEQDRAHDFLADLAAKWSEPLSRKYKAAAITRFEGTGDGYTEVALAAVRGMVAIIFNDMQPAFSQVFVTSSWKDGTVCGQLTSTLAEYLEDARVFLIPDFFYVFSERLCRDVVLEYLRHMVAAQGKVKVPKGRDRILDDVKALYAVFTKPEYGLDVESVRETFKVFGVLTDTLEAPLEEAPARFQELREIYWDAPLDLFELMIGLRKGVDRREIRDTMAKVRHVAIQTQEVDGDHDGDEEGEKREKSFLQNFRK